MYTIYNSPDRVTKQEDGSYRWVCEIGRDYERRSYKATMKICGFIAAFVLIYGSILSYMYRQPVWIIVVCAAGFLLIAFLICFGLDRLPGRMKEVYHLTEEYIETGSGKTRAIFSFERTRELIISDEYIELHGRFGGPRIYAPEEDMPFVRSFVSCRIPGTAVIRQERDLP